MRSEFDDVDYPPRQSWRSGESAEELPSIRPARIDVGVGVHPGHQQCARRRPRSRRDRPILVTARHATHRRVQAALAGAAARHHRRLGHSALPPGPVAASRHERRAPLLAPRSARPSARFRRHRRGFLGPRVPHRGAAPARGRASPGPRRAQRSQDPQSSTPARPCRAISSARPSPSGVGVMSSVPSCWAIATASSRRTGSSSRSALRLSASIRTTGSVSSSRATTYAAAFSPPCCSSRMVGRAQARPGG